MGRKEAGAAACALFAGEAAARVPTPRLTQCGLGQGLFCTQWRLHPSSRLATTDMGQKLGAVPL